MDGRDSRKRSSPNKRSKHPHSSEVRHVAAEPEQYKQFEEVLEKIDPFGIFQVFACICMIVAQIEWSEPAWSCLGRDGLITNITYNDTDKCNEMKKCKELNPINGSEFTSIVSTFKLVCDDAYKTDIIQIVQAVSLFIGSVIGGHIADWFGRQFGFFICQLGIAITSCMTIASRTWIAFSVAQFCNGILYGIIEVESLVLMMELTNNHYRMIPNACFQTNVANVVIALIAFLTTDWRRYFVFLNLVSLPVVVAFMLFCESPRWLLVKGKISAACNVLNDLSDTRWNGTGTKFTPQNLALLPRESRTTYYTFYHLFGRKRFVKQSFMQILSMITYAIVFVCYLNVLRSFKGSTIKVVFLDGAARLIIPIVIIILDLRIKEFTRRFQFLLSLGSLNICSLALIGFCLVTATIMTVSGLAYNSTAVTVIIAISAMIADSVFWMNIIQVTTQRYPTVIRGIAFGCLHGAKHLGTIIGILVLHPLMDSSFPAGAFIFPLALVVLTLVVGVLLQPDTKGKALLDTIEEADYTRIEHSLPNALMKMAAMHRVIQTEVHQKLAKEKKDEWAQRLHQLEVKEEEERRASMISTISQRDNNHVDAFKPDDG